MEFLKSNFALGLFQTVFEKIKTLVVAEASLLVNFDVRDKLGSLERKLSTANSLLDYFQQSATDYNPQIIEDVMRVCYDAEDLIDECMICVSKKSSLPVQMKLFFTRMRMIQEFEQFNSRRDGVINGLDIVNRTNRREPQCLLQDLDGFVFAKADEMPIFADKIFGRDLEKEKLITSLLQERESVCVAGMEGIGKTSVALMLLRDCRIREHYDFVVWLAVSAKFDIKKTKKFLSEQELSGKKVLIVLDDVFSVNYRDWYSFVSTFSKFSVCQVLLTTSNLDVAVVTKSTIHVLPLLSDAHCLDIIREKIKFSPAVSSSNYDALCLEDVVRMMGGKCKGIPLAAARIGCYLCSVKTRRDLMMIAHKEISELKVFTEEVLPTCRPDIAPYLKRCFAYCSLFPPDYNFKKDIIIRLWMAEGFVVQQQHKQTAADYFEELLSRFVFQISSLGNEDVVSYKMHNFMRLYSVFLASTSGAFYLLKGDECPNTAFWHDKIRHLSVNSTAINKSLLKKIEQCGGLRTLLFLSEEVTKIGTIPSSLFERLVKLRVLDISFSDIAELPKSICKLKQLRYLDASFTKISKLPNSFSELHGLQVLKLLGCVIVELPLNLKNFTDLQHFEVDMTNMRQVPQGIGHANCLETLSTFKAVNEEGSRIRELKNLKNLSGSFTLLALEDIYDANEAKEALIFEKPYLKCLMLEWGKPTDELKSFDVLNGLRPHNYLCELKITRYGGSSFPEWLSSSSCKLVSIHLCHCPNVTVLPPLGQLPLLKDLSIKDFYGVFYIDHRFCGEGSHPAFPSLETLKICKMESLIGWKDLPDCMFSLRELLVTDCPFFFAGADPARVMGGQVHPHFHQKKN